MVRRPRSIAQFALLGVLAVLAFPSAGSALAGVPIALTATGPVPAVQTVSTVTYPLWINQDTVTHTVAFANGRCTVQVAPGQVAGCPNGFSSGPGDYPYTVDGTGQASVVVRLAGRTVTLDARSHTITAGARLTLHGKLASFVPLPSPGPPAPVTVLARPDRYHPFHRIAVVKPKLYHPKGSHGELRWRLLIHPQRRAIYIAEADSQPQIWQQAWSRPFRVRVGR